MSDYSSIDYELADEIAADTPERHRALGSALRLRIVDLVLERAMTVTELAERVGRKRGTVAYHVDLLVTAGLLKVVRTRKVRAIDERFYGRTARTFRVRQEPDTLPFLVEAEKQAAPAQDGVPRGSTIRHARIPAARAQEYVDRLHALALEFSAEPRGGDTEFALMFHLFATSRQAAAHLSGQRQANT